MIDKLHKAIRNNNGLYEAIFRRNYLHHQKTNSIWYSLEKTPPLYSNLITLSTEWQPDEIFRSIDLAYEKEKWQSWSIKDSFGVLDLEKYGFKKLFTAEWIYLEFANFKPKPANPYLSYKILTHKEDLSAWRLAWDSDEQLGKEIFVDKLLNDQKVKFVAGYQEDKIVSGCFVNKTDDVLGISNFFPTGEEAEYWSDMINFIFNSIEKLDIVGYEQNETVNKLHPLGFESIGNLSIFIKHQIPLGD